MAGRTEFVTGTPMMSMPPPTPAFSTPIRFDPLCRAAGTVKDAIDAFTIHLQAEEGRLGLRLRQRREADGYNFRLAVEALACNLLITAMVGPGAILSVPRGHGTMWGKGRYHHPVYGQHFLDVLDLLKTLRLVTVVTKGYRFSHRRWQATNIRPAHKLACHLPIAATHWNAICRAEEPEVIVLRSSKDDNRRAKPIDYFDNRNTMRWRRELKAINGWLTAAQIELINGDRAVSLDRGGQPLAPHRRTLVRIYNNGSFEHGGRLWGAYWLTMERQERFRRLRIDGEPIANVDYMQLFPRLAYALAKINPPKGDLYDVSGDGYSRDGWKQLINALLFTQRPLKQWPEDTREHFPEGTNLRSTIEAIKRKHAPISCCFERGLGFRLMRIESDILVRVVTALFKKGVTALPIHDAVLVARSHAGMAKEVMEAEFILRTGASGGIVKVEVLSN